jgi:hypothetical protein
MTSVMDLVQSQVDVVYAVRRYGYALWRPDSTLLDKTPLIALRQNAAGTVLGSFLLEKH